MAGNAFTGAPSASTITRNNPPPLSVAEKVKGSEPVQAASVTAEPPTVWTTGASRSSTVTVDAVIHRKAMSGTGPVPKRVRQEGAALGRHTSETRTQLASV